MNAHHPFGGSWTDDKLMRLRKYLDAYMKIFSVNERAKHLKPIYVDAFAGTGYRSKKTLEKDILFLPEIALDEEADRYQKGSVKIALEVDPPFSQYVFIERNRNRVIALEDIRREFPLIEDRISIEHGDANSFLANWCKITDWKKHRAVVFLDPYGMQVEWKTMEAIAATQSIDLWILFPLMPLNRLLTRNHLPEEFLADRITVILGTEEWRDAFYTTSSQQNLFDDNPTFTKDTDTSRITAFFNSRLERIFAKVAPNSIILRNSKNSPLYLLCFATANPKSADTAVKIANHILKG